VGALPSLTRAQAGVIRALVQDKRVRAQEGAFILEGAKACLECICRHPESVISLTVSSSYLQDEDGKDRSVRRRLKASQFSCTDSLFEKLSDVPSPQGILGVVRVPHWDENQVWRHTQVLGIYGDSIRDPANVGAIIRTAAGLNLTALWLSSDSADCFNPKVVRSTAGAILDFPIFYRTDFPAFRERQCCIYSAVLPSSDSIPLRSIKTIPARVVLAVGNEGHGLNSQTLRKSDVKFCIPLAKTVESLNVSATVAISAFYMSGLPIEARQG
jgi:TrmH family RNA methyltransferase